MVHIRAVIKTQNTCNRGSWPQEISKEKNNKMCGNSSMKKGPQQNPVVDLPWWNRETHLPWPPPPSDAEGSVRRDSGAWTRAPPRQPRRLSSRAPSASRPLLLGVRPAAALLLLSAAASVPGLTLSGAQRRAAMRRRRAGDACRYVPSLASRSLTPWAAVAICTTTITPLADAIGCKELCTRRRNYQ
jgi:hypothetical protein